MEREIKKVLELLTMNKEASAKHFFKVSNQRVKQFKKQPHLLKLKHVRYALKKNEEIQTSLEAIEYNLKDMFL